MTLAFERRARGRKVRYSRLGTTLTRKGRTGANSVYFNARKRGFRAGQYRVIARARDATGKRSATVKAGFRVSVFARLSWRFGP